MINGVNKKKIVGICPVGVKRTKCPSIKKTRQMRTALLLLQRDRNHDVKELEMLRQKLREKKKAGIAVDCETCIYNT